jgi:hypothetical protein
MDDLLVVLVIEDDQAIQSIVEEALTEGDFSPAIAAIWCPKISRIGRAG